MSASATSCNNQLVGVMPPELGQSVSFWSLLPGPWSLAMALGTRQNILDPKLPVVSTWPTCPAYVAAAFLISVAIGFAKLEHSNFLRTIVKYSSSIAIIVTILMGNDDGNQ